MRVFGRERAAIDHLLRDGLIVARRRQPPDSAIFGKPVPILAELFPAAGRATDDAGTWL
jgi:hypothetical protein